VLATVLNDLKYLHFGLAAILIFAGAKMLTSSVLHVPQFISLAAITGILTTAIVPRVIARRAKAKALKLS
jgi:tellurite resistance protein TerC